jgi:tetratricopeptide (TPR) repeat protein
MKKNRLREHPPSPPVKPSELSTSKRRLFWAILVALPFSFIVVLELFLRYIDYGGNADLVTKINVVGKDYYTLNREVAKRYFTQKGIGIPETCDDIFEVAKQSSTKRIFMLGESTMAGFPYEYSATAPFMMKDRLRRLFPQYNIEVVNVGLSAINSYTVRDFIKDLVNYQPDAFIVYLGHNEFYGALGVGSTEYLGKSRALINLYLSLNRFRTFRLLRNAIASAKDFVSPAVTPMQGTLMEAVVRKKSIPLNSEEYRAALQNFEGNLRDIAEIASEHHVPMVLSTLTSNLRDQAPFVSEFSPQATDDAKQRWKSAFDSGEISLHTGNFVEALAKFQSCIQSDSMNAIGMYRLAQCYDTLGDYTHAFQYYTRARDLDCLRFRASSDFNEVIRRTAASEHCVIADAESSFARESPHGLTGKTLILEHLHPNIDGYFLLAKTFTQALTENNLIAPASDVQWNLNLSDSGYRAIAGITDFDLESGRFKIQRLMNSWPFKTDTSAVIPYQPQTVLQHIVVDYESQKTAYWKACYELANWYSDNKQYDKAIAEFYALSKVTPYNYGPLMQTADVYHQWGKPDSAEAWYKRALKVRESPYVHYRLGMFYFEQEKLPEAIRQFESAFAIETTGDEIMDDHSRSMARFFLGAAYGRSGDITQANANLQLALQIDPNNADAKKMLKKAH